MIQRLQCQQTKNNIVFFLEAVCMRVCVCVCVCVCECMLVFVCMCKNVNLKLLSLKLYKKKMKLSDMLKWAEPDLARK